MGAINSTAAKLQQTQASSTQTSSTGTPGSVQLQESQEIEAGYEEFAEEQNPTGGADQPFNQDTWNAYIQQLGNKMGGSLDASGVNEAMQGLVAATPAKDRFADHTTEGHMLPTGTTLQFSDGSQYTVKPGDKIDYDSLPAGTSTRVPEGMPGYDMGFVPTTSNENPLAPSNQGEPVGPSGQPRHFDYYASLYDMSNPLNPASPYNPLNMKDAPSTDQTGTPADDKKAGDTKHAD